MKKIKYLIVAFLLMGVLQVNASTTMTTTNSGDVSKGDTFKVKVSITDVASWNVHVTPSGPVTGCAINQADTSADASNTSKTFEADCTVTGGGTIKLALSGDTTTEDDNTVTLSDTISITAKDPDKAFTLYLGKEDGYQVFAYADTLIREGYGVPLQCSDEACTKFVYCYERTKETAQSDYASGTLLTNPGLVYLLNKIETTTVFEENKYADHWIKQVALWIYIDEEKLLQTKNYTTEELTEIQKVTKVYITNKQAYERSVPETATNLYNEYIKKWIDEAKKFNSDYLTIQLDKTISVKETSDKKFYETDKIEVSSAVASLLKNYEVSLSGISDAFIVDAEKKKIEGTIEAGKEFYIRIPVDKISGEVQKLNVVIKGNFNLKNGAVYSASDSNLQRVAALTDGLASFPISRTIQFTGAPSTGINMGPVIYFIGSVILLCGIGIIFVNTNPAKKEK